MLIHLQLNQRMKMQGTGPWRRLKARVLSLTERNSPKASGRPESAGGCNCKAESWKRSGRGKRRMQPQMMILGPIQVMALKAASVMMRTWEEEWVRPLLVQMSHDYIYKAVWFPGILAHWWETLGHLSLQAQLLCNLSSRYWPHCLDPAQGTVPPFKQCGSKHLESCLCGSVPSCSVCLDACLENWKLCYYSANQ